MTDWETIVDLISHNMSNSTRLNSVKPLPETVTNRDKSVWCSLEELELYSVTPLFDKMVKLSQMVLQFVDQVSERDSLAEQIRQLVGDDPKMKNELKQLAERITFTRYGTIDIRIWNQLGIEMKKPNFDKLYMGWYGLRSLPWMYDLYRHKKISCTMWRAIIADDLETFMDLLQNDPQFDLNRTYNSMCASEIRLVDVAAYYGSVKIVKYLIASGAICTPKTYTVAVCGGNKEIIRIIDGITTCKEFDLLQAAMVFRRNEVFEWLIQDKGFDLDISCFIIALDERNFELVKLWLFNCQRETKLAPVLIQRYMYE